MPYADYQKQIDHAKEWARTHPEARRKIRNRWDKKNREAKNATAREDRKKDPLRFKGHQLKYRYGLSISEVESRLKDQRFQCPICKGPLDLKSARVDHNHTTNQVRGLLCGTCNTAVGMLQDSVLNCIRAGEYLTQYEGTA